MSFIVAVDGPAGSGKSTISKVVGEDFKLTYLDTGAMYRMITYKILKENVNPSDTEAVVNLLDSVEIDMKDNNFFIDGEDVSNAIRTPKVTSCVSEVAAIKEVRENLVYLQQKISEGKDVILDGRDIGTVVFPNADLKIFLVASPEERARRRVLDFESKGINEKYEDVLKDIIQRDKFDSTRKESPLKKAEDAIEIDTSSMNIYEVVEAISTLIREKRK